MRGVQGTSGSHYVNLRQALHNQWQLMTQCFGGLNVTMPFLMS
jgi:hypothetical protein